MYFYKKVCIIIIVKGHNKDIKTTKKNKKNLKKSCQTNKNMLLYKAGNKKIKLKKKDGIRNDNK